MTYVQTDRHTITIFRDGMIINYYKYFCLPGVASTMVKRYNMLYLHVIYITALLALILVGRRTPALIRWRGQGTRVIGIIQADVRRG